MTEAPADLSRAVADADAVLARLDLATLETRVEIQGFTVTRFWASTTPWSTLRCTPGRSSGSRSLALVETLASARLRVAWRFPAGSGQAGDP